MISDQIELLYSIDFTKQKTPHPQIVEAGFNRSRTEGLSV